MIEHQVRMMEYGVRYLAVTQVTHEYQLKT